MPTTGWGLLLMFATLIALALLSVVGIMWVLDCPPGSECARLAEQARCLQYR